MSLLTSSASAQFVYSGTMAKEILSGHHNVGNIIYSNVGDTIRYSISYTNLSTLPVVVQLNDNVPSNLTINTFLTNNPCMLSISGTSNLSSNGCTVLPGTGNTIFFDIVATVNANSGTYTIVTNT